MLVPQTVEYALRAMAFLATRSPGDAIAAKDLSKASGVPVHYLSKVLRRLVRARLLHAWKGHGGGFVLARPKEQITMLEVLGAVGWSPNLDRCAFGWGSCDPEHPCPLHPTWSRLNDAYGAWASTATLGDVGPMPGPERTAPRRASTRVRAKTARKGRSAS